MAIGSSWGIRFWCFGSGDECPRHAKLQQTGQLPWSDASSKSFIICTSPRSPRSYSRFSSAPILKMSAPGVTTLVALVPSLIFLPFLPCSPESRLLHLPEDPDERIAVLERIVARPLCLARERNALCASSSYSSTVSVAATSMR